MKLRLYLTLVASYLLVSSMAFCMSGKGAKCPDNTEVQQALVTLAQEPQSDTQRDIFDLNPSWDMSLGCRERVLRGYIALPPQPADGSGEKPQLPIKTDINETRKGFSVALKMMEYLKKPEVVAHQEIISLGGVKFMKFSAEKDMKPDMVILYLHGGGYILNYDDTNGLYIDMLSKVVKGLLEKGLRADVLVPYYRIRPEHPLSASLDDAYKAYKALNGTSVIMGDSAGGGLALRLLLKLKQNKEKMPKMAVLLSPWSDLTNSGESFKTNANKDMFSMTEGVDAFTNVVLGDRDPKDPMVSPLFADYTGFPKLLYVVGGAEIFLDDTMRDVEKAKKQGVEVELIRHEKGVHVYPGYARFLPESKEALDKLIQVIKENN